ncbi:MAG TPA: endolytic transglycosylase MltG [Steroidobacteraceae bacterium]
MQSADAGKMLARLAAIAALLAGAALYGAHRLEGSLEERSAAVAGTRIQVHPGASLRAVLGELARVGAVPHPRRVEWELRLHGESLRALAGSYELAPGETVRQILAQLNAGQVVLEQLTIVEGWTFAQLRQAFDASSTLTHEWRGLEDGKLMAALGQAGVAPEGRFFPDTYRYAAGTSDRRLYELAMQRMQEHLQQEWAAREPNLPLADAHAALILASIIEKETAREDERNKVAAVFINRLRIGMRLQSDPTIIYGLGRSFDGNLRRRDLETDGPYNSYTRGGLPPTPIALPGDASLRAALHPAAINALYFVATGRGDGSHHFSASYAEHNEALRQFLKRTGAVPDAAVKGGGG